MDEKKEVVVQGQRKPRSILAACADRWSCDPAQLSTTLKQTAFKQRTGEVTDAQMMALLIVANQYGLNPFTKEIYAYPDKNGGVIPVVSVDGWNRIMQDNPRFESVAFEYPPDELWIKIDDDAKTCPPWIAVIIKKAGCSDPVIVREYLDETYRPAFLRDGKKIDGPWQTHTKRMLRHKAMIQGARIAFGFGGIYDEDEAARITSAEVVSSQPIKTIQMPREKVQIEQPAIEGKEPSAASNV